MSITPEQERAFNAQIDEAIYRMTPIRETIQVSADLLFGLRGERWTLARLREAADGYLLNDDVRLLLINLSGAIKEGRRLLDPEHEPDYGTHVRVPRRPSPSTGRNWCEFPRSLPSGGDVYASRCVHGRRGLSPASGSLQSGERFRWSHLIRAEKP